MALAPTAATPMPPAAAAPLPDAALDAGMADEGAGRKCIATICENSDGTYVLYAGDEPEEAAAPIEGEAPMDEGQTFDTPQALMRGVMELLNPAAGAEDSFGKGFRGEEDATAAKPDMPLAAM